MMKNIKYLSVFFMMFLVIQINLYGQNYLPREKEIKIKTSGNYYWGEGSDFNNEIAQKNALVDLTNQVISANILQSVENNNVLKSMEVNAHISKLEQMGKIRIIAWIAKDSVLVTNITTENTTVYSEIHTQNTPKFTFVETAPEYVRENMQKNANAVFEVINNAYYQNKQKLVFSTSNITEEAISRIQSLWETSSFYCTEKEKKIKILRRNKSNNELIGWQTRDIPVFFTKGDSNEDKLQNLVIDYSVDGRIIDISISVKIHQYNQIFENSKEVTDLRNRQLILEFIENFRTSYNRKDKDYLNKVFSDDALIITGKVLKTQKRGDTPTPLGVQIEYVKQSKKEYLTNLTRVFRNNEYINIKFENIEIVRHDIKPNIYGITLHQKWNTTNYKDEGWLFLIIDFKDIDNPLIWVRTWQPYEYIQKGGNVFILDDFVLDEDVIN